MYHVFCHTAGSSAAKRRMRSRFIPGLRLRFGRTSQRQTAGSVRGRRLLQALFAILPTLCLSIQRSRAHGAGRQSHRSPTGLRSGGFCQSGYFSLCLRKRHVACAHTVRGLSAAYRGFELPHSCCGRNQYLRCLNPRHRRPHKPAGIYPPRFRCLCGF